MSANGKQTPRRPRIEIRQAAATPEEAAAVAAAIEQFLRDTAPAPEAPKPTMSAWLKAGLLEGTGRDPTRSAPWGTFSSSASTIPSE